MLIQKNSIYKPRPAFFFLGVFLSIVQSPLSMIYGYPFPEVLTSIFVLIGVAGFSGPLFVLILLLVIFPFAAQYYLYSLFLFLVVFFLYLKRVQLVALMLLPSTLKLVLFSVSLTILLAIIQYILGSIGISIEWQPYQTFGEGARSAGFKAEPSMLSTPIVILGAALALKGQSTHRAVLFLCLGGAICLLANSLLCWIVWLFFLSLFAPSWLSTIATYIGIGVVGVMFIFVDIGEMAIWILEKTASWRTLPDAAMIIYWSDFLLPTFSGIQEKLSFLVARFSERDWVEWTYSMFSNAVVVVGYVGLLMIVGWKGFEVRRSRVLMKLPIRNFVGLMLALFLIPKYEILSIALLMVEHFRVNRRYHVVVDATT